ncbi:MAG: DUF4340 domain-containing protein [Myxococcota bacterium]
MDRSQSRLLLVLSALLIAASTWLYLGGNPPTDADAEATAEVWSVDAATVKAVVVTRASGTLRLEKRGEEWFVLDPEDLADGDQVRDLLDTLAQVKKGIPVEGVTDPAQFGLGDPPSATVAWTTADGEERSLVVGLESPVGFRTYARDAGGGVVAVNGDLNRPLQAEVGRFRDRHVLRFQPGDVRGVRIVGPDGTLNLHGQGLDWVSDGFGRADPDRIDDLVVGLHGLRFDQLGPPAEAPPEPVSHTVSITLADGDTVGFESRAPGPDGAWVASSDGRSGTVWPEALAQLGRGPSDVGLELLFGIRIDQTDTVTVSSGGESLVARRNGASWSSDAGDEAATYTWVSALASVRASIRPEPPPMPASVELTVAMAEGDRKWVVEIGPAGADGYRSAHDTAADAAVRIPADSVAEALAALR